MTLYLDTSSLVKLYLDEAHSDSVHEWMRMARMAATSPVAYPEMLSALARRHREGLLNDEGFQRARAAFRSQWSGFALMDLNETLAGELAITHALRALDAIHLAAAVALLRHVDAAPVVFTAFDVRLARAARAEGFRVLDASEG